MKIAIESIPKSSESSYQNLEPILEELLALGNVIETNYRWGCDRTGYFCTLKHSIDVISILSKFELPENIYFTENGSLWCGVTGCRIQVSNS